MPHALRIKRRTVLADDPRKSDRWVRIEITIGERIKSLTRDESKDLLDLATSKAMTLVTELPFVHIPLSRLKVSR